MLQTSNCFSIHILTLTHGQEGQRIRSSKLRNSSIEHDVMVHAEQMAKTDITTSCAKLRKRDGEQELSAAKSPLPKLGRELPRARCGLSSLQILDCPSHVEIA